MPLTHPTNAAFFSTSISRAAPTPVPEWASPQARLAAEGFLKRWHAYDAAEGDQRRPASEYVQTLDANQLGLLRVLVEGIVPLHPQQRSIGASAADLGASAAEVLRGQMERLPAHGEPLLPAEHLVYFTPRVPSSILAPDGSDPSFNPPGGVFTRRMWAGGEMDFLHHPQKLCIGAEVTERTFVEDVLVKRLGGGAGGEEMLVVWVRKEYVIEGDIVLRDRRSWVFRQALASPPTASPLAPPPAAAPASSQRATESETIELSHSPTDLFRFSALTYNAHQIHLDAHWARTIEGHNGVVVHGPLNVLLLCRFWLSIERKKEGKRRRELKKVVYRAKSPVCAHEAYRLVKVSEARTGEDGDVLQAVRTDSDKVIMEATIFSSPLQ
ncbi:hypothetical protein OC835_006529 [Tilletia horrida]|nr:hypothetical protein OC835_006529 [Tilletia horrida]